MSISEKQVVLLRHGIAEDRAGEIPDSERRLTEEGNRKMKKIAKKLAAMFPGAEVIYTSPLVRAAETAQWVASAYDSVEVRTAEALAPGGSPEDFISLIAKSPEEKIICVGHEPNLTTYMAAVTGISHGAKIDLKKGGCYGIRMFGEEGQLEWMLAPRLIV